MADVNIRDIGALGLIKDIASHELPPEAWTHVQNVAFVDGFAKRILGETQVEGAPTGTPNYLFPSPGLSTLYWTYTNLLDIWAVVGGVHTEITRVSGDYTGAIDDRWNDAWLNGIQVFNNGKDVPQLWNPISAGTKLIDLTNWPASTEATVIRAFDNLLIALDVTKASTRFPTMMKWSDTADAGNVPSTWDPTDTSALAGELPVGWTAGFCVDGRALGPSFIVYKEDAIIRADRVATNDVFALRPISLRTGIMAQECAQEYQRGKHVVFTRDADVVVNDGQSIIPVSSRKIRRHLRTAPDGSTRNRSFVVVNYQDFEAWFCYPRVNSTLCDEAAVWNWEQNTWSVRDLSDTLDIKAGIYDEASVSDAWSAQTETWASVSRLWASARFIVGSFQLVGAFVTDVELRQANKGLQLGTTSFTSVLERTGLSIAGQSRSGNVVVDPTMVKSVTKIWPIIDSGSVSMIMQVEVGSAKSANGPYTWEGPKNFDPTTDQFVDFDIEGPFLGVRFISTSEVEWKFYGYTMEITLAGKAA